MGLMYGSVKVTAVLKETSLPFKGELPSHFNSLHFGAICMRNLFFANCHVFVIDFFKLLSVSI